MNHRIFLGMVTALAVCQCGEKVTSVLTPTPVEDVIRISSTEIYFKTSDSDRAQIQDKLPKEVELTIVPNRNANQGISVTYKIDTKAPNGSGWLCDLYRDEGISSEDWRRYSTLEIPQTPGTIISVPEFSAGMRYRVKLYLSWSLPNVTVQLRQIDIDLRSLK